ncbi:hypothetical protein Tco_0609118 [Tanacetum coccineum]
MVAFLEKSTGSKRFHQVIDFLNRSHICYALTKKPDVYISFIKQFWRSVEATNDDNGEVQITATIDGHSMTITEASLRRHLKLDDHDSITSIPNSEIFEQLALMGYHTDSDNPKKTAWEQFSSNIATAVIYMQRKQLQQHSRTYPIPSLSIKVFNNIKRPTKGYSGQEVALFPTMLNVSEPSTSPSRITSSPSQSPEPLIENSPDHTTAAVSFPSLTQLTQPSPGAEQHIPTPNESPLHVVHSHRSVEASLKLNELMTLVTNLSKKIGELEDDLKETKLTYSAAVTKLILRGRKLSDAEVQEKASTETEPIIQEVTPTEVIQDQGSNKKGNSKVSTAGATKGTASEVPVVSTAEVNISTAGRTVTYRRRSEEKRTRKDKGKAIMTETEPKKKSKKELEQERLSFAEAIRLQEQMDEEQRAQIARDEEIARQWDEEEGQRAMSEAKSSKKIDWNDPSVIRIKETTRLVTSRECLTMRLGQILKVWDFNQHIEPMYMEHGSEKMKSPEKIEEKDIDTQEEIKEVVKEPGAKRKKSIPRKRRIVKRQKLEEDAEKEKLKGFLDIIPRERVVEIGDGSSKNYKVLSEMLEDFNRQDVEELCILVKERYSASRPEGYDLMLWGDLHTLFEPDEEDEIWKNQHEYNMLKKKLEVDHESSQAFKLLSTNGVSTASTNLVLPELVNTDRRKINTADGRSC